MTHRRRWPSSDALDDLFLQHYAGLVSHAQRLVRRDRQAAEDLVHDVYVRLALREFDAGAVQNVEGYLFMTLRNVHLSQVRRRVSKVSATVSIIDYESVVSGLRHLANDEERRDAYDALQDVVRYACLRKPTSKAASVLILRFFHGYYADEIARVVQTSEAAVAGRLRMARAEARAHLADPGRLHRFDRWRAPWRFEAHGQDDMASVLALRQAIFEARTGACLTDRALDHIYAGRASDPLDVAALAHLVSCAACLDNVNRRLGLPLLADRDPADRLGRGGPSSGGGRGGGGSPGDLTSVLRTRLKDAREDHPEELQVAVNGLFVGSQAVSGPLHEQRLKILVTEQVGFVEVFDEHDMCLLYLDVEPPPSGAVEQSTRVALSEGRQLSATLAFSDASPIAHVVYDNPSAAVDAPAIAHRTAGSSADAIPGAAAEAAGAASASRTPKVDGWSFWPVPLRFVIAGIILGALLANPRQTLAAAEQVRRAIVSSVEQLLEQVRPRRVLPSRPITSPTDITPLARPGASVSPILPSPVPSPPPVENDDERDLRLSETALEALRLLDGAGALTREQVGVERRSDRRLHVEGVVGTDARRHELTAALRALPASRVRVDLVSLDQAPPPQAAPAPSSISSPLRSAELTRESEPAAYAQLRRYVVARESGDSGTASGGTAAGTIVDRRVDDAVRRLSGSLLSRSLQARVYGRTVRELVASVPPRHAARLSSPAQATWHGLVRRHAELFRLETASLRRDVEQIFGPSIPNDDAAVVPVVPVGPDGPNGDVWQMAARLFALGSAHDVAVRRACAVVTPGRESLDVSTPAFRRSLLEAERLAEALLEAMPVASTP